jgi:hypothetical protein
MSAWKFTVVGKVVDPLKLKVTLPPLSVIFIEFTVSVPEATGLALAGAPFS